MVFNFPNCHRSAIDADLFCKRFLRKTCLFADRFDSFPIPRRHESGVIIQQERYIDAQNPGKLFGNGIIDILFPGLVVLDFSDRDAGKLAQSAPAHITHFPVITESACRALVPAIGLKIVSQMDQASALVKDENGCVIQSSIGLSIQLCSG